MLTYCDKLHYSVFLNNGATVPATQQPRVKKRGDLMNYAERAFSQPDSLKPAWRKL